MSCGYVDNLQNSPKKRASPFFIKYGEESSIIGFTYRNLTGGLATVIDITQDIGFLKPKIFKIIVPEHGIYSLDSVNVSMHE